MNKLIYVIIIIAIIYILFKFFNKTKKPTRKSNNVKLNKNDDTINYENDDKNFVNELSYDIKDEQIIMSNIKKMSIEEISQYADKLTKKFAKDINFLHVQIPKDLLKKIKKPIKDPKLKNILLNPTTLGNAAYIAVNSIEPYKSRSKKALIFLLDKL